MGDSKISLSQGLDDCKLFDYSYVDGFYLINIRDFGS